jgi:acetyltransferase-like isoleucine patch superfamily enzyme
MSEQANRESVRIQQEVTSGMKSKLTLYSDLIVGKRGFWALIKYELIMLFCSRTPGALGLFLRARLYPCLFRRCGRNVNFGTNVVVRNPNKIELGDNVIIDDNCLLDAKGRANNGITIEDGVFVGRNSILSCKNGDIILRAGVNIGFNCEVFSGSRVEVGPGVLMAAYSYLIGGDHEADATDVSVTEQGSTSHGILVEDGAWLGAGCLVRDGVKIGGHAIIGAGAVVTRDIPEYAITAGVPARVLRDRREPKADQVSRERTQGTQR